MKNNADLMDLMDWAIKALRRLRWWLGIPVALIAIGFVGQRLYWSWTTLQETVVRIKLGWVLLGFGVTSLSIGLLGWNWISVLSSRGVEVYWLDAMRMYFTANLARYIPGGIWHFAGRTLWLAEQGHRPQSVVESLALEQGITLFTAVAIGFSFSRVGCWKILLVALIFISGIIVVLSAGVTAKSQNDLLGRYLQRWTRVLASYGLFWILQGLVTLCLVAAIAGHEVLTVSNCAYLIGVTASSWAAGYMIFFVPSGWGVRELVLMHLLLKEFPETVAVFLPVLARLVQIAAELLCTGVSWVVLARRR